MAWSKGGKYQRLADYLTSQPGDEVTLSFAQITAILERPLPATAYLHEWWTARVPSSLQAQSWRQAGWDAIAVMRRAGERWVTFRRRRRT